MNDIDPDEIPLTSVRDTDKEIMENPKLAEKKPINYFYTYERRDEPHSLVLAARVTTENLDDLAHICGAEIVDGEGVRRLYFRAANQQVEIAEVGDFVMGMGSYWPVDKEVFESIYRR